MTRDAPPTYGGTRRATRRRTPSGRCSVGAAGPGFSAEVHHLDGSVRVALRGELDGASAAALLDVLGPLASRYDRDQLTIDCTVLEFIDARGLDQLLVAVHRFAPGGRPTLVNPTTLFQRILDILQLDQQFVIEQVPA